MPAIIPICWFWPQPRLAAANCSPRPASRFEVHPAHIPEDPFDGEDPARVCHPAGPRKGRRRLSGTDATNESKRPPGTRLETSPLVVLGADTTVTLDDQSSASPKTPPTPRACCACSPAAPIASSQAWRSSPPKASKSPPNPQRSASSRCRRRNRRLCRHRRAHGQGRRLRHPGPRRPLDSAHRRLLLQRRRPAPGAGFHHAEVRAAFSLDSPRHILVQWVEDCLLFFIDLWGRLIAITKSRTNLMRARSCSCIALLFLPSLFQLR